MSSKDETLLKIAIEGLRTDTPGVEQITAAGRRVAGRLGMKMEEQSFERLSTGALENCEDVRSSFAAYRSGNLTEERALLIKAHLGDCGACLRRFRSGSETAALDWTALKPGSSRGERSTRATTLGSVKSWMTGWAMAPVLALLAGSFFVYRVYWQVPPGVRAEVQSIDGAAYLVSAGVDRQVQAGDKLGQDDRLRIMGGGHAVLKLADGSTVEANERSVMGVGARGRSMTLTLDSGAVIVQAAKRESGHLYVKTPDCRVAVTGTIFSVNSGIKGSRVAVLQGSVHMMHAGLDTVVNAGGEAATNENLNGSGSREQVQQEIAWSRDRERYLPLLAQFATLQQRIEAISLPKPRYTSDLLPRVPASTLLYVSIPNLGDFLSEANKIFNDQLKQSPDLQQWWNRGHEHNTADLDRMVDKLHSISQYLGEEVVVVGVSQANHPGFAVMADVQKSGLRDFLNRQSGSADPSGRLVVLDEGALSKMSGESLAKDGEFVLIREHEAVFSNSIATLMQIDAQFNAGASGFSKTDFGQQIAAAYGRGAGVILAADLPLMVPGGFDLSRHGGEGNRVAVDSGLNEVQYLIAEHRETGGMPENHLNLQFSGTRQRIASWLAAPGPIGSLDYVTPNAELAIAGLTKDPKAIADDLMSMAFKDRGEERQRMDDVEQKMQINLRDDIAANLGGDFLISLDGPVLPTPSWKTVIQVHDAGKLEQTLESLTETFRNLNHDSTEGSKVLGFAISSNQVGSQRYYDLHELSTGRLIAEYAFSDGYMVIAASRAMVIDALHAHTSGDSLARSAPFKASLPKDGNDNYSAIAYQNLSPVLTPLLSQMSGESARALQKLAVDAKPTSVCAWGRDNRIEAESDSHLFGFDFLALGTLLKQGNGGAGNKYGDRSVRD